MNYIISNNGRFIFILSALLLSAAAFAYYGRNPGLDAADGKILFNEAAGTEETLLNVLKENPYDIEVWESLGDFYQSNHRLDEALNAYQNAYKISNGNMDLKIKTAVILARMNKLDESESIAVEILSKNPNSKRANKLIGWLTTARLNQVIDVTGRPDLALLDAAKKYFLTAVKIDSNDPEAYVGLGGIAKISGSDIEAIRYFKKALELDSTSFWAWQLSGEILKAMGSDSEAKIAFTKAAEYSFGRPDPFKELAELARKGRNYSEAASYMQNSGRLGSFTRGRDLETAGDFKGAEAAYLEHLLYYPEDEIALERLELLRIKTMPADDTRRIELSIRRIDAAERAERVKNILLAYHNYRRAINLAPQFSEARLKIAKFLSNEKAYTEAVNQLQRVEELTRSQRERLVASDLMEAITREALTEMENVNEVSFKEIWDLPTSQLGMMIGDPEIIEQKIRWSVNPVPKPKLVIAVMPLNEVIKPFHSGIGDISAEWIKGALELFQGFQIISLSDVKNIMQSNEADPFIIGKQLNADVVIFGKIIEGEERLKLELKAIRISSSKILYSTEIASIGPLSKIVIEIADELSSILSLNGSVLRKHDKDMITVNLGRIHGIREGDTIEIIKVRREILTPGLDWSGIQETIIAEGIVKGLTERYSEVKLSGNFAKVSAGDLIRRKRKI